ncbi:helix-turn-helix domain-containing protein [Amycolatopsis albispora]|uniref:Uncharacterized protein n=1 Tax=Amycolatopsis albispora TaxID=1804986 RepID=A0A344LGX2_9PSEU|nr:helix-turn-helix domain-containing protein [Amycolatopsis albispora]AXB47296.1 hypothetical protein A4R43_36625 [Amycolatopsis albispora]
MTFIPQSMPNPAEQAEKREKAWELKLRGLSDAAIGEIMGVSRQTIANWRKKDLNERLGVPAAEWRERQLVQLERMYVQLADVLETSHPLVSHGKVILSEDGKPLEDLELKLKTQDRILRNIERTAKLLGLDAPVKAEIEDKTPPVPAELIELLEKARAEVSATEARLAND